MTMPSPPALAPKLKFTRSDRFIRELRRRVDAYFERTGRRRRDCPQMYFKTGSILAWFFGAYFLLMFVVTSWWAILPLAIVLGLHLSEHRRTRRRHQSRLPRSPFAAPEAVSVPSCPGHLPVGAVRFPRAQVAPFR
jgi:hypothetical protein